MTRVPGQPGSPPRVAYAIGRRCGPAVARNRLRRRLRAAVREHRALLVAGSDYLVAASPPAVTATYRDISDALRALLDAVAREEA